MTAITTEDKVTLQQGDRAYNYYDMKPGFIERIFTWAQPNAAKGQNSNTPTDEWDDFWFIFRHDDGTSADLNGSRICSTEYAQRKGWR